MHKKSIITVYAWCSGTRKPINHEENEKKTSNNEKTNKGTSILLTIQHAVGWILEMLFVLTWQLARLFGSIVVGSDAKKRLFPIVQTFHFPERKIEALRMHRILLHCCTVEHESIIQKSLQNQTFIPDIPKKRKALCIINPKSGNRDAGNIMRDLQPFMNACSELIEFSIQGTFLFIFLYVIVYFNHFTYIFSYKETTHAFHAKEIANEFNSEEYNLIICVGGDGIPYEIVNGIMDREDGEEIIKKISIAIIPAGTGNGITASLGIQSPQDSMLRIIHGNVKPFDVMIITQENNVNFKPVYSLLQVSYGMMSDVDFESEVIRFCGDLRFTMVAFYRLIFLRKYPVDIIFDAKTQKKVVPPNKTVVWEDVGENNHIHLNTETIWCGGMNTSWLAADFNCAPGAKIDDGLIRKYFVVFTLLLS